MTLKFILQFKFLIFLVLFSAISDLSGQDTGSIAGYITEENSMNALADVNVRVKGTSFGASSDENGYFIISEIPVGEYTLSVSSIGYQSIEFKSIKVEANATHTMKVTLIPAIFQMEDIVVTGTRSPYPLKTVPIETYLLSSREIKSIGLQTSTDAIRWLPGVTISGGAPNGAARRFTAMIHGLPSEYSMILIDGLRAQSEHIHTGINLNLVPVSMIQRIEVVKGPASALYGSEAFGGVINIITKPVPEKSVYTGEISYGKYNTLNMNFAHGSKINKISYYINANMIRTDGVPTANNVRYDYNQKNLLAKLSFNMNGNNIFKLSSKYYENKYLRNINRPKVRDSWLDLAGQWESIFSEKSKFKTVISYAHFKGEYREDDNRRIAVDAMYENCHFKNHTLSASLEVRKERFSRNATAQSERTVSGLFLKDEGKLIDPLAFIFAVRADHYPDVATELTPRLALLFNLTTDTDVRATVGRGFRAPSLQDLYEREFDHGTYYRNGNPNLKPEYAMNYKLALEHHFSSSIFTRISGFRNDFTDMIVVQQTGDLLNNKPVFKRENIRKAVSQGGEAECRLWIGNLNAIFNYTYCDSKDDDGFPLAYAPEHMVNTRLYYNLRKISLGTTLYIEHARNRYYKQSSGSKGKLDGYTLVNLSINKNIIGNITAFIRIENILDQEFDIYEDGKSLAGYGRSMLGGIRLEY